MGISIGRGTRLAALGAGLATAAAVALSAASPALADATDGTGTATVTFSTKFLTNLAKWGIAVIPENPATSSDTSGADAFTFTVTGGTGSDTNFSGNVDLGGALTFIDGATGKTVQLTNLQLDYFDGVITAVPAGTSKTIWLADVAGALDTNNSTGIESFSASRLALDPQGVGFLNNALRSTAIGPRNHKKYAAFVAGANTISANAFTISYSVTFS